MSKQAAIKAYNSLPGSIVDLASLKNLIQWFKFGSPEFNNLSKAIQAAKESPELEVLIEAGALGKMPAKTKQKVAAKKYRLVVNKHGSFSEVKKLFEGKEGVTVNKSSISLTDIGQIAFSNPNDCESCFSLWFPTSQIKTDPKRFQNRESDFSEESVERIVKNYDLNKLDPVVVWRDPKTKEVFMLSGHSRLEAHKRLGKKQMPTKFFEGSENDAINFAKVFANRSGTPETLLEDIKAYKILRDKEQATKEELKRQFPRTVNLLERFSYLDPKGLFLSVLSDENKKQHFPNAELKAGWAGELRKMYPALTNAHEAEIFDYLFKDKDGSEMKKDDFYNLMGNKVMRIDFKSSEPLLLKDGLKTGTQARVDTAPAEKRLQEIRKELKELREQNRKAQTKEEKRFLQMQINDLEKEYQSTETGIKFLLDNQKGLFGIKIANSNDLAKMKFASLPFTGEWKNFIGLPEENFAAMVWGKPKQGKSYFSIRFAKYLSNFGRVLYIAAEEGFGLTLQKKLKDMNASGENLDFAEANEINIDGLSQAIHANKYKFVVFDSYNKLKMNHLQIELLRKANPSTAFVIISQATKDGNYKGSQELEHDMDVIINVENGVATQYGRFNQGGEFHIFNDKTNERTNWSSNAQNSVPPLSGRKRQKTN